MGKEANREARIAIIGERDHPALKGFGYLPEGARIVIVGTVDQITEADKEVLKKVNILFHGSLGFGIKANPSQISKIWPHLPNLEWVSVIPAGINAFMAPELIKSNVILTNGKGTFSNSIAEFALAACLYFAKKITELQENQRQSKWEPIFVEELRGRTLGIVGYGDIGQRVAELARVFGMHIIALRRRTDLSQGEIHAGTEAYPPDQLNEVIAKSDYVVNALPSTPATQKLISKEALSHLQPHAVLINVGRGTTTDEQALIEALKARRFRGAALDVFEVEPLSESSPLWQLDNVLISPHSSPRTVNFIEGALKQFAENVRLFVEGRELNNVCDKEHGY